MHACDGDVTSPKIHASGAGAHSQSLPVRASGHRVNSYDGHSFVGPDLCPVSGLENRCKKVKPDSSWKHGATPNTAAVAVCARSATRHWIRPLTGAQRQLLAGRASVLKDSEIASCSPGKATNCISRGRQTEPENQIARFEIRRSPHGAQKVGPRLVPTCPAVSILGPESGLEAWTPKRHPE